MKEQLSQEAQNDLQNIMAFLDAQPDQPTPTRPPGFGITATEYAQKKLEQGEVISVDIARIFLNQQVKNGLMEKKQMVDGKGTSPMVYFMKG